MDKFTDYINLLKVDYNKIVKETLQDESIKKDMIEFNQKEQLQEGIDSNDKVIETIASKEQNSGYPYSKFTVSKRGAKGLQVNRVDLKDTGAFYDTFEVEVRNDESEIKANYNVHGEDIRDNFDSSYDFLGLTDDNLEGYTWQDLFPVFAKNLQKSIIK